MYLRAILVGLLGISTIVWSAARADGDNFPKVGNALQFETACTEAEFYGQSPCGPRLDTKCTVGVYDEETQGPAKNNDGKIITTLIPCNLWPCGRYIDTVPFAEAGKVHYLVVVLTNLKVGERDGYVVYLPRDDNDKMYLPPAEGDNPHLLRLDGDSS